MRIGNLYIALFLFSIPVLLSAQTDSEDFRMKLSGIQSTVDSLYPRKIDKFIRYKNLTTMFIGVNKTVFHDDPQKGFGISIYYPVGLFFSNYTRSNDPVSLVNYSTEFVENLGRELTIQGIAYTPAEYSRSQSNYTTWNAGVYLSAFRPVYFMAGISVLRGQVWDLYKGDYGQYLISPESNGEYALDCYQVNSANFLVGVAIVYPFIQVEAGYNHLFKSFFINVGVNAPIFNVRIFKPQSKRVK